ncbi:hypothetical protein WR25_17430 [Diploscapter pachys]|uniref:Uncharacterized protein n=1 Tax=Diploscapter pachys TaxID=2018661 RepID=A0A2A2JVS2_9BILA|nr:hypothetical protein WR25_17430 [Diploscapter pachys]
MTTRNDLAEEVFGECIRKKDHEQLSKRVTLEAITDEKVHEINDKVIEQLDDEEQVYLSIDTTDSDKHDAQIIYPSESCIVIMDLGYHRMR